MNGLLGNLAGTLFDPIGKALWQGSLTVLRAALSLVGKLGQVDPTPGAGPISSSLWSSMLGLAAVVAVLLFFAQLIMAVLQPRRHMLTAVTGPVQYAVATGISVGLVLALLGGADGLTTAVLSTTASGQDIAGSLAGLGLADDVDGVKGMVLGVMAVVGIVPLALGYGITLLFRSAAILVLIATLPITAAGLVSLSTKHWFWRATRWLLALIFLKPTFALCFAIGAGVVRTAGTGQAAGNGQTGIVTLLLGLGIMFIALFAPFALFRLFAFVEPGTQPHQTLMAGFGSAVAGFKQAGSGIANADVGSVLSGATGGRFGAGSGSSSGDGGGSSGSDGRSQAAATAALAAATGGASAAASGATAGEAGAAGAGAGTSSAGGSGGQPVHPARPGAGSSAEQQDGAGDEREELAGAGAASPGQLSGAPAAGGGRAGAGGGASPGGTAGASGGGAAPGSLAGVAGSAAAAAGTSLGAIGGGRVGASASAMGSAVSSAGGGAYRAAAGIAGAGPMPPAPQGGAVGRVGDYGPSDYAGGGGFGAAPRPLPSNPYRDPSYDRPPDDGYAGAGPPPDPGPDDPYDDFDDFDDQGDFDDESGRGRWSGVL